MLTDSDHIQLASSSEFQAILQSDPVLNGLEAEKYDPEAERFSLFEMLGNTVTVAGIPVQPVTPAVWAVLWAMGNKFTTDVTQIRRADVDMFFYLLKNGLKNLRCTLADLPVESIGAVRLSGLDYDTAAAELIALVNYTFRPLRMMPSGEIAGEPVNFDAYWLAQITSVTAEEMNIPAREVMYAVPLSACYYYCLSAIAKSNPDAHIRRWTPGETAQMIVERAEFLGEQFLKNLKGKDHAGNRENYA